MADGIQPYLHMDGLWMWRFFFLDKYGNLIATSSVAYFTRAEAEVEMLRFCRDLVCDAELTH